VIDHSDHNTTNKKELCYETISIICSILLSCVQIRSCGSNKTIIFFIMCILFALRELVSRCGHSHIYRSLLKPVADSKSRGQMAQGTANIVDPSPMMTQLGVDPI